MILQFYAVWSTMDLFRFSVICYVNSYHLELIKTQEFLHVIKLFCYANIVHFTPLHLFHSFCYFFKVLILILYADITLMEVKF